MTAHRTPALPIRRTAELEIPSAGTWPVVRSSSIARSTGLRDGLRQLHVVAGRIDVGELATDSSLRIDLDDATWTADAVSVAPDRNGMSEWQFVGFADTATGRDPLTLTLNYHGVYRRGVDAWAWLSGGGTIGTPPNRRLRRSRDNRLIVDLLLTAPDFARIPRIPAAQTEHSRTRVMQVQPVALAHA